MNAALTKHGLPEVAGAVVVAEEAIPVGITGKVLKRILREQARTLAVGS